MVALKVVEEPQGNCLLLPDGKKNSTYSGALGGTGKFLSKKGPLGTLLHLNGYMFLVNPAYNLDCDDKEI
jgi:hypothetical protein